MFVFTPVSETTPMMQKKSSVEHPFVACDQLACETGPSDGALVMIAEDDDDNRLMLRTMLEMRGYRVAEARDGAEAIAVAQCARPDMILIDLQLPRLDGFAVTRFMRHDGALRDVPIVVISAHDPGKHRALALAAGCDDYLTKPINFAHLEKTLCGLLDPARRSSQLTSSIE